jgi:arabinose-5-phosphate isomerase
MNVSPRTIGLDMLADEALGIINATKITSLFVVENERPIGIIHVHDLLRAGVA